MRIHFCCSTPSFMKTSLFAILLGSAIFATQNASATLLVGFHDFDGTVADESADYALAGFSGTVVKNGEVSVTGGGSNDGYYGNTVSPGFTGLNPGINDGYLRSLSTGDPVVQLTNSSAGAYSLSSLLFDAANQGGGAEVTVTYRLGTSGTWLSLFTTPAVPDSGGSGVSTNYGDYLMNLVGLGVTLMNGQSIQFKFDGNANGRIDNIALTGLSAIPEPASLLALGCLLGSGVFMRQRRRTAGAALQLA